MNGQFSKIHPELRQIAKKVPKFTYNNRNVRLLNLLMRFLLAPASAPDVRIENVFIPSEDGRAKIRLRIYAPQSVSAPTPALLWMHGGGYVIGRPEQNDGRCIQWVRELGLTVVSVDYRYGASYPFPAGLEDCYAALQWTASRPAHIDVDETRIAIGGESAGGGLAAALVHLAHDRREIMPAFQLLVYPMLDDRTALRTDLDDSDNVTWNQKSNRFGWETYLGGRCGADDLPEYCAPARRKDLSGLPPAWIGVGTLDLFYDEATTYAQRLNEAGVACDTEIVPGAFHGFDVFAQAVPVVQNFRKAQIIALRKFISSPVLPAG